MIDGQVELSRMNTIKSGLLLLSWNEIIMLFYLPFKNMLVLCYTFQNMIYYAFTCFIYTCYTLLVESCQAFLSDPTLGIVGIKLFAGEQDIVAVQ